jgi:hypothetical protein
MLLTRMVVSQVYCVKERLSDKLGIKTGKGEDFVNQEL